MGGACSAYGGKDKSVQGCGGENLRKEITWETQA